MTEYIRVEIDSFFDVYFCAPSRNQYPCTESYRHWRQIREIKQLILIAKESKDVVKERENEAQTCWLCARWQECKYCNQSKSDSSLVVKLLALQPETQVRFSIPPLRQTQGWFLLLSNCLSVEWWTGYCLFLLSFSLYVISICQIIDRPIALTVSWQCTWTLLKIRCHTHQAYLGVGPICYHYLVQMTADNRFQDVNDQYFDNLLQNRCVDFHGAVAEMKVWGKVRKRDFIIYKNQRCIKIMGMYIE